MSDIQRFLYIGGRTFIRNFALKYLTLVDRTCLLMALGYIKEAKYSPRRKEEFTNNACKDGNLQLIDYAIDNNFSFDGEICAEACAKNGLSDVWIKLWPNHYPVIDLICIAAKHGRFEFVKRYYRDSGALINIDVYTNRLLELAGEGDNLQLFEWLREKFPHSIYPTTSLLSNKNIEMSSLLLENYNPLHRSAHDVHKSIQSGNISLIRKLMNHWNVGLQSAYITYAVYLDQLDVMIFFRNTFRAAFDEFLTEGMGYEFKSRVLKWLMTLRYDVVDAWKVQKAIEEFKIVDVEILAYMFNEHKFFPSVQFFKRAALKGRYDIIDWGRVNGLKAQLRSAVPKQIKMYI